MASAAWEEDEHELCNDDGFIYKRRKRIRLQEEEEAAAASASSEHSIADLKVQQKKRTLAKLTDRYQKEISQWEILSNTLREMEERVQQCRQSESAQISTDLAETSSPNQSIQPQLDELLRQAEAQAAIFQDISMLCDACEAMCKAEEEKRKQLFLDLPIWVTPQDIFACLCDDDDNCNADDT